MRRGRVIYSRHIIKGVLVSKDHKIRNVVTLSIEKCKALEDPSRAMILHILSHKPMTTERLADELRKNGYVKAVPTIRHHLDVLRDCGLIEVVMAKEIRGTVEKYYASTIKFLGLEDPSSVEGYDALIKDLSKKLTKITSSLVEKYKKESVKKCAYCNIDHEKEYVIFEIINRALAEVIESKEYAKLIEQKESNVEKAKGK